MVSNNIRPKPRVATLPRPALLNHEPEAKEYRGRRLTPIGEQQGLALPNPQVIDKDSYRLTIDGLVERPLSLSYQDLLARPQLSRLTEAGEVEGWGFSAKWTGPSLADILKEAGVKPEARLAVFHTADVPSGYSALPLEHINANNVLLAMKDNDVTLTPAQGFPFLAAAGTGHAYEWPKWVTHIELTSMEVAVNFFFCSCFWTEWWWLWWIWRKWF